MAFGTVFSEHNQRVSPVLGNDIQTIVSELHFIGKIVFRRCLAIKMLNRNMEKVHLIMYEFNHQIETTLKIFRLQVALEDPENFDHL